MSFIEDVDGYTDYSKLSEYVRLEKIINGGVFDVGDMCGESTIIYLVIVTKNKKLYNTVKDLNDYINKSEHAKFMSDVIRQVIIISRKYQHADMLVADFIKSIAKYNRDKSVIKEFLGEYDNLLYDSRFTELLSKLTGALATKSFRIEYKFIDPTDYKE